MNRRGWWLPLAVFLVVQAVTVGFVFASRNDVENERDARITENRHSIVVNCQRVNAVTKALKDAIDVSTAGIPAGASERIDKLRMQGQKIKLLDCPNIE